MQAKEKWEEIYTKNELRAIQTIEKEILKEFIKVCNELKIEYFIYGGTLLGQVKYGDIIPWDDDIDVALTRENYNKFLAEAPSKINNKYVIQSPYNEKRSPFSYTKIRKRGTLYIEEHHHKLNIEKGIYIDVYPIDNIPDNEKLRRKQWKKSQLYCKLYYLRQCKHVATKNDKFNRLLKHTIAYYVLRVLPQSFYLKKIDKNMSKYNNTKTERKACLFSPNYGNIFIKIYPLLSRKFGEIEVMIPNCYEDHLRRRYGNYEKDIPPSQRIGHVPFEFYIPHEQLIRRNNDVCYKKANG